MTHLKKKLLIKQCPDGMRWYAPLVGDTVPYLGDMGNEYKSREPAGHINFVQYDDAEIVNDIGIGAPINKTEKTTDSIYTNAIFVAPIIETKEIIGDLEYYRYKANFVVEAIANPSKNFDIKLNMIDIKLIISVPSNYYFMGRTDKGKLTISFFNFPLDAFSNMIPEVVLKIRE